MKCALIDIIAGACPHFMKIAPINPALEMHGSQSGLLRYGIVNTGDRIVEHLERLPAGSWRIY